MNLEGIRALASMVDSPVVGRAKNVMIRCPMAAVTHKGGVDTHPSMSVKVSEFGEVSLACCFSCGFGGSLLWVFRCADAAVGGFAEAVKFIESSDTGSVVGELEAIRHKRSGGESCGDRAPGADFAAYVARCYGEIPSYLIERGVIKPDVIKWKIGYDRELRRVVFPVFDEDGVVVGATRRAVVGGQRPKYLDTPGLPKREVFYGEHLIDRTRDRVHIVEGPLDAVFASRVLPNVVALLGSHTGVGKVRMRKLLRWCRSVVLILDGDTAGAEAASELCGLLKQHFIVGVSHLPEGHDPASLAPAELLRTIMDASYFL